MPQSLKSSHTYLCLVKGQPIPSYYAACPYCGKHVDETTHLLLYKLPLPLRVPYRRSK